MYKFISSLKNEIYNEDVELKSEEYLQAEYNNLKKVFDNYIQNKPIEYY